MWCWAAQAVLSNFRFQIFLFFFKFFSPKTIFTAVVCFLFFFFSLSYERSKARHNATKHSGFCVHRSHLGSNWRFDIRKNIAHGSNLDITSGDEQVFYGSSGGSQAKTLKYSMLLNHQRALVGDMFWKSILISQCRIFRSCKVHNPNAKITWLFDAACKSRITI